MREFLLANEGAVRLGFFFSILVIMAILEVLAPKRLQHAPKTVRWANNLGIVALNSVLMRLIFPVLPVGAALWFKAQGWGLFNMAAVPEWTAVVASVMVLDLAIYAQHVVFHKVPVLWRLHRMHHADTEFDVTTGARFHPIEIALSLIIKMALIGILGAPAAAVIVFEVLLNATAMFNHANFALPVAIDRWLRLIVVTPDMHRVHHSDIRGETDSNYGFNLPWWDRLFGTYRPQPERGHDGMTIGLPILRAPAEMRLDRLLTQPFRNAE